MGYTETRYTPDPRREVTWKVLAPYLHDTFALGDSVLDVGCGYGDFINHVPAAARTAVDLNASFATHLADGVRFVEASADDFHDAAADAFPDEQYSAVFSSNLLEHLTREQIERFFDQSRAALRPGGRLVLLLPNYARCAAEYFDDYTHITPISHAGLHDWLEARGFRVTFSHPGFMPLTVKNSAIPVTSWLVRAWLASPLKPFGKQMLFVAEPDGR